MLRWTAGLLLSGLLGCQATENAGEAPAPGLEVGAFVVDLTPPLDANPVWMAGFGHGRSAEEVHDPIEARAIVLVNGEDRLALVAVDLIGLFHEEVLAARRLLAESAPHWSDGNLIVAATHNHEGPDTMGLWGPTQLQCGIDPEYNDRVVAGIVRAVLEAERLRRPARLRLGQSQAPELLVDSRQPQVFDDRVLALRAVDRSDETIATLINFGCHPEAMGSRNRELTADYPFFTRRLVERKLGGTAVFFSGAIGGLMTQLGLELEDPETGAPAPKRTFRFTEIYGESVGRAAVEALAAGRWSESAALEARFAPVDLPLTNPFYKTGLTLGIIGGGRTASRLKESGGEAWVFQSEVGVARIGDAELLLVPGEIYPELVTGGVPDPAPEGADFPDAPIEPPLLPRLTADYRFIIGLAGDEIGYILPKRQWDQRKPFAYGLDEAPYGEINSVGPDAAAVLSRAYDQLLRGAAGDR